MTTTTVKEPTLRELVVAATPTEGEGLHVSAIAEKAGVTKMQASNVLNQLAGRTVDKVAPNTFKRLPEQIAPTTNGASKPVADEAKPAPKKRGRPRKVKVATRDAEVPKSVTKPVVKAEAPTDLVAEVLRLVGVDVTPAQLAFANETARSLALLR